MRQFTISPHEKPELCVIWMHGLGADAQNMLNVAKELRLSVPVKHIALQAPLKPVTCYQGAVVPAWYDIVGLRFEDREDESGIMASQAKIQEVIAMQLSEGFVSRQIILAGFSQGGAMALVAGLMASESLGGILSLSGYLPLATRLSWAQSRHVPIFIAYGHQDDVVLPSWTQKGVDWLKEKEFDFIEVKSYDMAHTICFNEIKDIAAWLTSCASYQEEKV